MNLRGSFRKQRAVLKQLCSVHSNEVGPVSFRALRKHMRTASRIIYIYLLLLLLLLLLIYIYTL